MKKLTCQFVKNLLWRENPKLWRLRCASKNLSDIWLLKLKTLSVPECSRYRSTVSMWFEIMSSPLMTFIFKTFPKHRAIQSWNFLPEIWKLCNLRQLESIDFQNKTKKCDFSTFFKNKSFFFCLKLNSMWKMRCLRYCILK